jgi:hypothetical protein
VKRFVLLLLLVVGVACDEPGDQRSFSVGACEQFGVMEPVPVPSSCGIDIAGEGGTVRVFAVGAVIRYAEMEDYASFCTAWDEVVRTEVLPCLATDKPNLLVRSSAHAVRSAARKPKRSQPLRRCSKPMRSRWLTTASSIPMPLRLPNS